MNFLGMGPMEVLIVFLVAFIFLGHERMIDAARFMGKAVREVRRMTADLPELLPDEDTGPAKGKTGPSRYEHRGPDTSGRPSSTTASAPADEGFASEEGPVAFQSAGDAPPQEDTDPTLKQEQK